MRKIISSRVKGNAGNEIRPSTSAPTLGLAFEDFSAMKVTWDGDQNGNEQLMLMLMGIGS